MLLSRMRQPSICAAFRVGYMAPSIMYSQSLKVSMACFSAAPTTYTREPLMRLIRLSAQLSAATKMVLPFLRGMKMNASFTRRSCVPLT